MAHIRGNFGIEYNPRQKERDSSGLGWVFVLVAIVALISLIWTLAGIQNEKVYGFAIEGMTTSAQAKNMVKRERIGHVWNKINIPGHKDILVDITWMSRGQTAQTQKRLTPHMKSQELRKIKRERPTYTYNMKYFDFNYNELQKKGEYRFSSSYQMLK